MTLADVPSALALCRASHWNQTARDWAMFLRLHPAGCCVAELERTVIGTVTTVPYAEAFAWIGMVLVEPAQRGQGIGKQLLHEALARLVGMKCIRLDATPAGQPLYRKLGFVDEYPLKRLQARTLNWPKLRRASEIRPLQAGDLPAVAAWDRALFGADRRLLLEWLWQGAPEYAWVATQHGALIGYCFGRHGHNFEHFGPLSAKDNETAQQLLHVCLPRPQAQAFVVDIVDQRGEACAWLTWLKAVGFEEQRPFSRMFLGVPPPVGPSEQQFAILGPEFG